MSRPEAMIKQETRLLGILPKVEGYRIDETDALILTTSDGKIPIARRPDRIGPARNAALLTGPHRLRDPSLGLLPAASQFTPDGMIDEDAPDPGPGTVPTPARAKRPQQVYTLLVEVGRSPGDGLPEGTTGAALLIYASGVDEAEAVRESVAILKQADLSPLDVTGYGTLDERQKAGEEIGPDERALMDRALAENSVIVAQLTPFSS